MSKLKRQNSAEKVVPKVEEKIPTVEKQGDDVEIELEDDTDNDSLILVLLSSVLLLLTACFTYVFRWLVRGIKVCLLKRDLIFSFESELPNGIISKEEQPK